MQGKQSRNGPATAGSSSAGSQSKAARKRANKQKKKNVSGSGPQTVLRSGVAASYSSRIVSRSPRITTSVGSKRIQHRELVLTSVAGSTSFTVQKTLQLNPGLAATFPWLSVECQNWTQYTVHALTAEWVPILPTSSAGDVLISPNYNSSKPAPTTEQQAANNKDSVMDSVWQCILAPLDPAGMMGIAPRRFIRSANIAGDIKTFDVGNLFICTNNEAGSSAAGKLYLSYDIEFFEPEDDPSESTYPQQTSMFVNTSNQTFSSGTAAAQQFGTAVFDPLGVGVDSSGVFTPAAGCYRLDYAITYNDTASETFIVQTQVFKNGAALSKTTDLADKNSGVASADITLSGCSIVTCNGTDTFQIQIILTGSAGTLTSTGGYTTLLVSLA